MNDTGSGFHREHSALDYAAGDDGRPVYDFSWSGGSLSIWSNCCRASSDRERIASAMASTWSSCAPF